MPTTTEGRTMATLEIVRAGIDACISEARRHGWEDGEDGYELTRLDCESIVDDVRKAYPDADEDEIMRAIRAAVSA